MSDPRQPHAPPDQPTDAIPDDGPDPGIDDAFVSSRDDGSPPPPARPATPVSTRPLLHPDDGTDRTPPGPEAADGPLSPSGATPLRLPRRPLR